MTNLEYQIIKDNIFDSTTASDEGLTENDPAIIGQWCWLNNTKDIKGKQFSGVISQLNQKGYCISTDNEVIALTEKGFNAYQDYLAAL